MNFKIRTYLTVTILLLLLPTTVQAARQPRPSFYARYENFSGSSVKCIDRKKIFIL